HGRRSRRRPGVRGEVAGCGGRSGLRRLGAERGGQHLGPVSSFGSCHGGSVVRVIGPGRAGSGRMGAGGRGSASRRERQRTGRSWGSVRTRPRRSPERRYLRGPAGGAIRPPSGTGRGQEVSVVGAVVPDVTPRAGGRRAPDVAPRSGRGCEFL